MMPTAQVAPQPGHSLTLSSSHTSIFVFVNQIDHVPKFLRRGRQMFLYQATEEVNNARAILGFLAGREEAKVVVFGEYELEHRLEAVSLGDPFEKLLYLRGVRLQFVHARLVVGVVALHF